MNYLIVQYTFLDGEVVPIKMEPHGNSKNDCQRPYIRTQHSTLKDIQNTVATTSPKCAVKHVYSKAGGVVNANSLSELPRNRRQAINAKSLGNTTSGIASNGNKDLVYDRTSSP